MENQKLVTVDELTQTICLPRTTIWRYIREGYIPAVQIGRRYLVDPDEAIRALKRRVL